MAREEPWLLASAPPPDIHIRLHGVTFHLNKKCMVSRSAKLAKLLETSHYVDLVSDSSTGIPADAKAFELAARFCYGHDLNLSADDIVPLACVASFLEMTEDHSPGNLLKLSLSFFTARVLPHWNETVKAFRAAAPVLPYAQRFGLVDACLKSISGKALADPQLLGDPTVKEDDGTLPAVKSGARRRLFVVDWFTEDLTSLPVPLFELTISTLDLSGVPPENLALCIYRYSKRLIDYRITTGAFEGLHEEVSVYERSNQREVIEAVERMLPSKSRVLHIRCLVQLLRSAIFLQASQICRTGFEARIGKQLPEASIDDLFMPSHGYAKETKYDIECVKRIVNHFFASQHALQDAAALAAVAGLVENFLAAIARDANLDKTRFVPLLEMLAAMLEPLGRCHDGLYRAVDLYLDAHGDLMESEREEVCRVLNGQRMSVEACEHAVQNERMPLRVVAQVLFVGQLRIRAALAGVVGSSNGNFEEEEEEDEEKGEDKRVVVSGSGGGLEVNDEDKEEEEEVKKEMLRMDSRVVELERECVRMTREISKCSQCNQFGGKRDGWRVLKQMGNILGCKNDLHQCSCLEKKKVNPRNGGALSS